MFIVLVNGNEVFSHKSESQVRAFSRDYLKSEEHLGEIVQISKDGIENSMVFSSKKRSSGKISMIDITNEYQSKNIIIEKISQSKENNDEEITPSIENDNIIIGNVKYPRWEVYWKDADGCRIPKSSIVGLEWFTMNYEDPKEKKWMDDHGYTPDILKNILAIPVNKEEFYEELTDEWGQVKKIKRIQ